MCGRLYFMLLFLIPFAYTVRGQNTRGLSVGERLIHYPDVAITSKGDGQMASIRPQNSAIILDFGGLGCSSCVAQLPYLSHLNRRYHDSLTIIWVTNDTREDLLSFLTTTKIGKESTLPMIPGDSSLYSLFPHITTPYEVWIDRNGVVKAYTDDSYVDSTHIEDLIQGKRKNWPSEREFFLKDDEPLTTWSTRIPREAYPKTSYGVTICPHIPGLIKNISVSTDSCRGTRSLSYANLPLLEIYYQQLLGLIPNRYESEPGYYDIEVADRDRLIFDRDKYYRIEWEQKYTYSLEGSFPTATSEAADHSRIISELNFYFALDARLEQRPRECLVIRSKHILLKNVHTNIVSQASDSISFGSLLYKLSQEWKQMPVLDETGLSAPLKSKLAISLPYGSLSDLYLLNSALSSNGLYIEKETRKIKVFVIRDARKH